MEKSEDQHRTEIKVYQQKVKHLEYIAKNVPDAEEALKDELQYHLETQKKTVKVDLKRAYEEEDQAHQGHVESTERDLNQKINSLETSLEVRKKELIANYEEKLKKLREELQLRLKVEIHEIEERKNQHINDLMANHEQAFRNMKDFYTDVTRENLELI